MYCSNLPEDNVLWIFRCMASLKYCIIVLGLFNMNLFDAQSKDLTVFEQALQEKASTINIETNSRGETLLFSLLSSNVNDKLAKVQKVIQQGADVNQEISNYTPLMVACSDETKQDLPIISFLLESGANPFHKTSKGITALDIVDVSSKSEYKNPWPEALQLLQGYAGNAPTLPTTIKNELERFSSQWNSEEETEWVEKFAYLLSEHHISLADIPNPIPKDIITALERHIQVITFLTDYNFFAAQQYFTNQAKHIDVQWYSEQQEVYFLRYLNALQISDDIARQIFCILQQTNNLGLTPKELEVVSNLYAYRFLKAEELQQSSTLNKNTYDAIRKDALTSFCDNLTKGDEHLREVLFTYDSSHNRNQFILDLIACNHSEEQVTQLLRELLGKLFDNEELNWLIRQQPVCRLLLENKFNEANALFDVQHPCEKEDFEDLKLFALKRYFSRSLPGEILSILTKLPSKDFDTAFHLIQLIKEGKVEQASQLFATEGSPALIELYRLVTFHDLELRYDFLSKDSIDTIKRLQKSNTNIFSFLKLLEQGKFKDADAFLESAESSSAQMYQDLLGIKADFIMHYLHSKNRPCNKEQARAIAYTLQNFLLQARAGSGKTTTIINKAIIEVNKYNLSPEELRILTFNRDTVKDLIKKLAGAEIFSNTKIASTFHSFACEVCNCTGKMLDIVDAENASPNKTSIITQLLEKELPLPTREEMYKSIRNSCLMVEGEYCGQILMDDPEMLISLPQKYMADFLFEHQLQFDGVDIKFDLGGYLFYAHSQSYSADFKARINENNIFIRYLSSAHASVEQQFQKERRKVGDTLLEFYAPFPYEQILKERHSTDGSYPARELFEKSFEEFLQQHGVICLKKKDKETLLTEFFENYKPHFIEQCESLINQYQQKKWEIEEVEKHIEEFILRNPLHEYRYLLQISVSIYRKYKLFLKQNNKIDYNTIMAEAADTLHSIVKGDAFTHKLILLKQRITKWKLLCIDEFQDFSPLFFDLIHAIKRINPTIRLFCVGDDWQAINGFAGSDTKFFTLFEEHIGKFFNQKAGMDILRTNRRSTDEILDMSNFFMKQAAPKQLGANGTNHHDPNGLNVITTGGQNSKILKTLSCSKKVSQSVLTKADALFQIMLRNSAKNPSYFVLGRREKPIKKLESIYADFIAESNAQYKHGFVLKDKVTFSTAHKSKGLESEIVVILVDGNSYPLYHPTSEMMKELFNLNWKEQERNLFYVALTRAKKKIYFITGEKAFQKNKFTRMISSYQNLKKEEYRGLKPFTQFAMPRLWL